MTPDPFFYVAPDERVLLRVRAPGAYGVVLFIVPALVLTLLLVAALALLRLVPDLAGAPEWPVWLAWGALVGLVALAAWRRAATSEYVLTDQRIYVRVGRLVTRLHFTTHDKVTDIRYRQGPLERLFGLASLSFATAGGDLHLPGLRDALGTKAASERARDAFVRLLLQEAPPAALAPGAPAPDAAAPASAPAAAPPPAPETPPWTGPRPGYLQTGDVPVWLARPRPIAAIGALRSLLGLVPLLIFTAPMDPPRRTIVWLVAIALLAGSVVVRVVQLRRTEYVATDRRVYGRRGVVGTTVSQLTYDKITDITYQQDLLGRLLGYGTVTVQTAGAEQAPLAMVGLADPLGAKETIERWRDANVGGRR